MSMNLGLCCLLHNNKELKFRTYTKARLYRLSSDLIPHFEYITGRGLLTKEELDEYLSAFGSHDSSGICLSMHPGQHVAMGSNREEVIVNGAADLRLHVLIQDA